MRLSLALSILFLSLGCEAFSPAQSGIISTLPIPNLSSNIDINNNINNPTLTFRRSTNGRLQALPSDSGSVINALREATSSLSIKFPLEEIEKVIRSVSLSLNSNLSTEDVDKLIQSVSVYAAAFPTASEIRFDNSVLSELIASSATPWHLAFIGALTAGATVRSWLDSPDDFSEAPFEPGTNTYSPKASEEFYATRPIMVAKRIIKLGLLSGGFNTGVLFDWLVLGRLLKDEEYTALKKAEPQRAKEALILCEKLGPTFIKLGQALSIREDIVPAPYAIELRQLQDAVTPFDSEEAYEILRNELGVRDLSQIFTTLSQKPIASASIGQVYRGTLASDGRDVAVKVQRPGILSEIALDLYILRLLSPIQTTLQNAVNGIKTTQEDIDLSITLVDEWGRGFVAETDYRLEARNTKSFEAAMRKRRLDAVCAPTVVDELVLDKVLVTEWVEGTRLDTDKSPDVPRLCGVAINAYLTMLLDTGVLHCDPHPGNLLRTTDGRLCILDWGMTLEVPDDLQYALLEFIAHINVEDYDSIPEDFINLGFSPPDVTPERLKNSGITEGIAFSFRQLSAGGGAKKIQERVKAEFQERYGSDLTDEEIQKAARAEMLERMESQLQSEGVDVKGVTNVMEEMSRRNRELFQLPPYVLYVARAFSTLEGIGLSIDENYAIVQECYPYLSRRLFTDRNPRAKKALRAMLGLANEETSTSTSSLAAVQAGAGTATPHSGLKTSKLLEMSEGFASYTSATADVDQDGKGQTAAIAEFSKLFLDPKGSTLQDILVDETAKLGDAAIRSALRAALVDNPAAKAAAAAFRAPQDALAQNEALLSAIPGPLKEALFDRPANLPNLLESLIATTPEDERVLSNIQDLSDALGPRIFSDSVTENDDGVVSGIRTAFAGQLSDGALGVPQSLPTISPEIASVFSDEETRKIITDQLPGVAALGRRIGAGLLKRAAYRTGQSEVLPEGARKVLVDANIALADAIEPKFDSED
uniref:ABC1 atypical kinase-like domain-containing protein n=1 Tax=Eucampia antarctica TaxID=49252 RepID=A0A7S2SHE2_9STRA|mmetsp:Transcript_8361/g.7909  ORF Transcript_8361/g.7909 Transcript_8361/m.7909 type:complete len:989 (+) Transcript_8361:178-3144(+)